MPQSESSGSKDVAVEIQEVLKRLLGMERYALWFATGVRLQASTEALMVIADSSFTLDRMRKRLVPYLQDAAKEVYGQAVPVRLSVAPSEAERVDGALVSPADMFPVDQPHESSNSLKDQRPKRPSRPHSGTRRESLEAPRLLIPAPQTFPAKTAQGKSRSETTGGRDSIKDVSASQELQPTSNLAQTSLLNFCVGECNQLAFTAAKMVVEHPGSASPLFFWGPAGSGKTHLLAAVRNELRQRHHLRRVVMLSAEQFTNDFTGAVRGSGLPGFRRRYRDVEALLIDDVQFVGGKRATLRELLYTVDSLLRGRCQLAFTADRPPLELEGLNEELAGRMAGGMVCPVRALDRVTRFQVLTKLAERHPLPVSSEVLEKLADELVGDGRILAGAMNHLKTLSQMYGRVATWDELSSSAPDLIAAGRPTVNLGDIQKAVCDMFGIPAESLRTRGQQRSVSQPRMLAMYLARQYTRAAFSEIGEYFGNRSHSTVIAATKRVEDWIAESTPVRRGTQMLGPRQAIEAIENLLRTG